MNTAVLGLVALTIWLFFGIIGYWVGSSKGRGAAGFWLGFLLGPIGAVIVGVMGPPAAFEAQRAARLQAAATAGLRPCPSCAELIQPAATVCRYCHRDVEPTVQVTQGREKRYEEMDEWEKAKVWEEYKNR